LQKVTIPTKTEDLLQYKDQAPKPDTVAMRARARAVVVQNSQSPNRIVTLNGAMQAANFKDPANNNESSGTVSFWAGQRITYNQGQKVNAFNRKKDDMTPWVNANFNGGMMSGYY